jgi:hypothetical protein
MREEEPTIMEEKTTVGNRRLTDYLRGVLAIWFFAGMPLSLGLSGLYFVAGIPLPPLLNILSSLVYVSGSLLGGLWSGENLRKPGLACAELAGTLFVLGVSLGFLLLGIIFAFRAFKRL